MLVNILNAQRKSLLLKEERFSLPLEYSFFLKRIQGSSRSQKGLGLPFYENEWKEVMPGECLERKERLLPPASPSPENPEIKLRGKIKNLKEVI